MDRRAFLANLGLSVATMASSCGFSLEDGLFNPCLSDPLPERLRSHELVRAAWDGIQPSRCWDCHVHLVGVGDGDDGVWITPQMKSLLHPWQNLQRRFYLNAACTETEGRVDEDFVRRLEHCLEAFPSGAKIMLLAFDFHHDASGARREDLSAFRIADRYAAELAQRRPDRMEWICSIHPYREDVLEALAWAAQRGARAVKWLPSAMGMDPASPRCDVFYDQLTRLKLPLLTHAGAEQAVHGGSIGEYNNPLRLRRPLERGVRVIMAHCASLGEYTDTDRGADGPKVPAFALFARLMDEPRYQGELYGDISATVQSNRVGTALATLLARNDWHPRLINGSDYPLPGVLPLVSMRRFVEQGYLKQAEAGVLAEIRRYNPLLFDFVLKRSLVKDGGSFAPQVFESRRAFMQEA
ncbi:MAG TPA: amidohydrolase family protein [Verrucomicrobiae bacterium]|nr:amidohydrolase family protein [Verrucomicrobiae bacterium]